MQAVVRSGEDGPSPAEGDMVRVELAVGRFGGCVCSFFVDGLLGCDQLRHSCNEHAVFPTHYTPRPTPPHTHTNPCLELNPTPGLGTQPNPTQPNQAYVHYSVKSASDALLYSTRRDEGGSGHPFAFLIGKGRRAPRGWELALLGACASCCALRCAVLCHAVLCAVCCVLCAVCCVLCAVCCVLCAVLTEPLEIKARVADSPLLNRRGPSHLRASPTPQTN